MSRTEQNHIVIHSIIFALQRAFLVSFLEHHCIGNEDEVLLIQRMDDKKCVDQKSKLRSQQDENLPRKNFDAISSYTGLCLTNSRAILNLPCKDEVQQPIWKPQISDRRTCSNRRQPTMPFHLLDAECRQLAGVLSD